MKRIAIIGGGISGVSAAYELTLRQHAGAPIEFVLFEASPRLGGIVESVRRDGFVIECGPDSWVSEKPWARELAVELGLANQLISSRDEQRGTYLVKDGTLVAMPTGMNMMVPSRLEALLQSNLLSEQAKRAYMHEPEMAAELKQSALDASDAFRDESVQDFVVRHFGTEVAETFAAPLLAGIFGGNIATLSVRAVLPSWVAIEREYGSLILGLQQRRRVLESSSPLFTTLRNGLSGLVEHMQAQIAPKDVRCEAPITSMERAGKKWLLRGASIADSDSSAMQIFDAVVVATPSAVTRRLLAPQDLRIGELLPQRSSSAIVVALAFSARNARAIRVPNGFGFLVPHTEFVSGSMEHLRGDLEAIAAQSLLACTFVDQKFHYRVPEGGKLLRAFFGSPGVQLLLQQGDATLIRLAKDSLVRFLGAIPEPDIAIVRCWPESIPLYGVGHLDRIAELEARVSKLPSLYLIGNAYRGVGLPDLIHAARTTARKLVKELAALD